jgi:hypothetical protein
VDGPEALEPAKSEPFLLHESSRSFLDGDVRDIRQRLQFRRDALDYIAMAIVVAGALLLVVRLVQLMRGISGSEELEATVAAIGLAALLIIGGAYYVTSRHAAAAARARLIDQGEVLAGTMVACTARRETSAEAAFGDVTRTHIVTVDYRFTTPAGNEIADRDEHNRPDLRRAEVPAPDTAVRVLYLDESTYALL